jgi:hypothetical protein
MDIRLRWVVLLVFVAAACGGPDQPESFSEGMTLICDSSHATEATSKEGRLAAASRWIAVNVKNQEARELFAGLAGLSPTGKARAIREAASRAGLSRCALADLWAP